MPKNIYKIKPDDPKLQYAVTVRRTSVYYKANEKDALNSHIKTLKNLGIQEITVETHTITSVTYTRKRGDTHNGKPQRRCSEERQESSIPRQ